MFIIAIVFIAAAPSLSKKKYENRYFNSAKHGIYVCKDNDCNFTPPKGSNNLFIIAVGGGGGGAGTNCTVKEEIRTGSGNLSGGDFSITKGIVYRLIAQTGGAASVHGRCDIYTTENGNYEKPPREESDYGRYKRRSAWGGYEGHNYLIYYLLVPNESGSYKDKYGNDRWCSKIDGRLDGDDGYRTNLAFCSTADKCVGYDERGRCIFSDASTKLSYTIGPTAGTMQDEEGMSGARIDLTFPEKEDFFNELGELIKQKEYFLLGGYGTNTKRVNTGGKGPYVAGKNGRGGNGGCHMGGDVGHYWEQVHDKNSDGSYQLDQNGRPMYTENWMMGDEGKIHLTQNIINWGDGGNAGEVKSGYFKNVTGPVKITLGKGGKGGDANGEKGEDGTNTVVTAEKGGFGIKANSTILKLGNLFDKGDNNGFLIDSKGGEGGKRYVYYENCADYNTYESLPGKKNHTDFGKGGNGGEGGTVPVCTEKKGYNGETGAVYIFY